MKIAVLPGDGIGPEVTAQALKVLGVLQSEGMPLEFEHALIGGCAYDSTGHPLPQATRQLAVEADAILFGAEGGFEYETLPRGLRPGDALLALRQELQLFANFRPVVAYPELLGASPLKSAHIDGLDLLILRELTGDLYFGSPRGVAVENGLRVGVNTMRYDEAEIRRIAHVAFRTARKRQSRVCSVDKANVLESMELWREVMDEVATGYPDVALEHLYIDAAAMSLLRAPRHFDVIVTGNLFGDILSDEASMLTGSIGMLPSASIGEGTKGLYEPVHGCAPDIAGKDIANPLASILSAAMMLRMSFDADAAATRIERAVRRVLASGYRTADIVEPGTKRVGTAQMGDLVVAAMS
ncbi:3-isopropylmalate dehydrogenase [Paraburkholderia unamae]|uniref:3-isopropylmalate dehydrogenase n=1 Tax=Paraburkholderia unamae TaxID=219649 RepID=A0ABX5KFE5_9BURK|nr:3-isopropylmalate dehydrogenase [Paraburkholderia unamae]PVX75133.1 3-isopropylmalate dehydrogenase [Paraburkholderia unamae]